MNGHRKKNQSHNFLAFVRMYLVRRFSKYLVNSSIKVDDLIFDLGSLIYPKEMLKILQYKPLEKMRVIQIYNYLYKFSLERLQQLINN